MSQLWCGTLSTHWSALSPKPVIVHLVNSSAPGVVVIILKVYPNILETNITNTSFKLLPVNDTKNGWWQVDIGSGNGLLPVWRQAMTWTDDDLLSIGPPEPNLSEIWIELQNLRKCIWKLRNGSHFVQEGWVNVKINYSAGTLLSLTHSDQMTHICVNEWSLNWLKKWFGVVQVASYF